MTMDAQPKRTPRVLIVDDEPSIGFGLSRTLKRRGYEVATAATAAEARLQAQGFSPGIVLLDLHLPDEDGMTLIEELRRREPAPAIVVMTGFALPETAERARRLGAARVVQKPIAIDELISIVDTLAAGG